MDKRYIELEKAREIFVSNICAGDVPCKNCNIIDRCLLYKTFDKIPIADVAPVVHAHWEIKTKWIPLALDADPLDWDRYDEENHAEEEDYYACSRCGYDDGYWYGGMPYD